MKKLGDSECRSMGGKLRKGDMQAKDKKVSGYLEHRLRLSK